MEGVLGTTSYNKTKKRPASPMLGEKEAALTSASIIRNPIDLNAVASRIDIPREWAPYAMLNEKQLARLLGLSESLLQKQRVSGTGIRFHRFGRACRYALKDVIEALEKATYISTSQADAQ